MAQLVTVFERPVKMTVTESWDPMEIREMCINHDWYTGGTIKDYDSLLNLVQELSPTPSNMLRIAQDIHNHTTGEDPDGYAVDVILFTIANDVVMRYYEF